PAPRWEHRDKQIRCRSASPQPLSCGSIAIGPKMRQARVVGIAPEVAPRVNADRRHEDDEVRPERSFATATRRLTSATSMPPAVIFASAWLLTASQSASRKGSKAQAPSILV